MKRLTFPLILFLTLFMAACSGGSESQNEEQESSEAKETQVINIIGIDQLKFVVAEKSDNVQTGEEVTVNDSTYYVLEGITAEAGQELTINLKTISEMPPSAMAHNWLLLKMDADAKAFNDASLQAKENDYIAKDMEDQVITDTGLVAGGETASTTFTVPEQPGEYNFICTFPGHFAAGMQGTLTVN